MRGDAGGPSLITYQFGRTYAVKSIQIILFKTPVKVAESQLQHNIKKQQTYDRAHREAEYCDERVCVSVPVCLSAIISSKLKSNLRQFFLHVTYGRGSVLVWWHTDMLRISGFMDDVIFAHKPRLLEVAVRLRQ